MLDLLEVKPGKRFDLSRHDPRERFGWDREEATARTAELLGRLSMLQQRLAAEAAQSLLVILQAMDAAGKDGTIRRVFTGVNPQGVEVHSFKVPSEEERSHDFLWRVHKRVPRDGQIGVFNRSHYEDVLVVRVRGLAPETVWRPRYRHIREFERLLVEEGTRIVKVFLNVSYEEQGKRLQERIDNAEERWKFRAGDLDDRRLWPEYMAAYEEALAETSTDHALWYVVPADRKWVRDLCVMQLLVRELERMNPQLPTPDIDVTTVHVDGPDPSP
jgi:PPK2 family polyphosphate:nucleotide phosphotransferase